MEIPAPSYHLASNALLYYYSTNLRLSLKQTPIKWHPLHRRKTQWVPRPMDSRSDPFKSSPSPTTYPGPSFKDALLKVSPIGVSLAGTKYKKFFKEKGMVCRVNGLWPRLEDLFKWITATWKLEIKKEAFIYPCAKGYFIVEFNLAEDIDLILNSGAWF